MGSEEPQPREANFLINVPPELEGGSYANFLNVWHTEHEFTLDFAALQPPQLDNDDPTSAVNVPARVVARIRIPPTLVFAILQALNTNMTRYEEALGEIRRPEPRDHEETDSDDLG